MPSCVACSGWLGCAGPVSFSFLVPSRYWAGILYVGQLFRFCRVFFYAQFRVPGLNSSTERPAGAAPSLLKASTGD